MIKGYSMVGCSNLERQVEHTWRIIRSEIFIWLVHEEYWASEIVKLVRIQLAYFLDRQFGAMTGDLGKEG